MTIAALYAACGAILVGIGAFGMLAQRHLLRRVLAFNIVGSGIFLLFGGLGHRTVESGSGAAADPVPQAMVITGIVVALALTALAVTLVVRFFEETGRTELADEGTVDEPRVD